MKFWELIVCGESMWVAGVWTQGRILDSLREGIGHHL